MMPSDRLLAVATLALTQPAVPGSKAAEMTDLNDESDIDLDSLFDSASDSSTDPSSLCTDDCCAAAPRALPKPKPSAPTLPPELLLQILGHALSTALHEPCIVHSQFAEITTSCRTCTFRALCLVSRQFGGLVQEVGAGSIVLDRSGRGVRDDGAVVRWVRMKGWGAWVKEVDASLRGSNSVVLPGGQEAGDEGEAATNVERGERERLEQSDKSVCHAHAHPALHCVRPC